MYLEPNVILCHFSKWERESFGVLSPRLSPGSAGVGYHACPSRLAAPLGPTATAAGEKSSNTGSKAITSTRPHPERCTGALLKTGQRLCPPWLLPIFASFQRCLFLSWTRTCHSLASSKPGQLLAHPTCTRDRKIQ